MSEFHHAIAEVQKHYSGSRDVRPHSFNREAANAFFRDYIGFVGRMVPRRGRLLEVGCGVGWSSALLAEAGFDTVGVDLNPDAFEVERGDRLDLRMGDVLDLPFPDASFDVVAAYQMLEHIPDPARALGEIARVLRPGGTVCIVGPNLIAPAIGVRALLVYVWRNRPVSTIFVRVPSMPSHPSGNTLPEVVAGLIGSIGHIVAKLRSRDARFAMRTPDTRPPFHADNDACYLCNPIDLARYFGAAGFEILATAKPGRPKISGLLGAGTWFAARKTKS